MASFDVLVIGGGPAGLSAALAACRAMVKTAVFDSGKYRNSVSKHMHAVPGWDHRDAKDFRAAVRKDITSRYNTTIFVEQEVLSLRKLDNATFEATTADGTKYTGRKVVLATGVQDIYPDIPGYPECWGNAIFHCMFCHGFEERGGDKAGLLAVDFSKNPQMVTWVGSIIKRLAKSSTVYTHGDTEFAQSIADTAAKHGHVVDTRKIVRFEKVGPETGNLKLHFEDGTSEQLSFLAHTPFTKQNTPFAEQLGLELATNGDIKANPPFQSTSVPGVYAGGDCGTMFKSATVAMSLGGMAGVGAVHEVCGEV